MSAYTLISNDWRDLSEAASKERDPNKLMELIAKLNDALKEREERVRGKQNGEAPKYR